MSPPRLATDLLITIEVMQVLPTAKLATVRAWFRRLNYPWTSVEAIVAAAPAIEALNPLLRCLRGDESEPKLR